MQRSPTKKWAELCAEAVEAQIPAAAVATSSASLCIGSSRSFDRSNLGRPT
jgi:hypothetical protein